jgi:capsular exopolysaccharide synthesis family protein
MAMNFTGSSEIHLRDYWRVLKRRRWVGAAFFAVVVALVTAYAFLATPVYQGAVQLLMATEGTQVLDFTQGQAVVQRRDPTEYFNTQKEIMTSRLFIDQLARKLQLDKNPYFIEQKARMLADRSSGIHAVGKAITGLFPQRGKPLQSAASPSLVTELDPEITDIILENLSSETPKQSNVFLLKYTATDPVVAASVANGIADALIEYNLRLRVKPYQEAAEWLSARLLESKSKVEESEKQLQRYREGKGVVSFESKESVLTQQLQQLVTELVQTENRKQEAEIRYNQLLSVINTPERLATVPEIMNNVVVQGLRKDELDLKRQLSELSEKFGAKHPQIIRLNSQLDSVQKSIVAEARKMLDTSKTEFEIAKNRELSLRQTMEQQKQEVLDLSRKAIDFNVIAGESASNRQFYDLLLKKLQEASLSSGINASTLQIVDLAVAPDEPLRPRRGMLLALAIFLGGFGGVFFALFVEYMDSTIRSAEDVEKFLKLPFLEVVPLTREKEKEGALFLSGNPTTVVAEAFRTIRTGVLLSMVDAPQQVLLVTSSIPNEGKTTVSANLALALAQSGERVLVVDADLRRHNLHKEFGFDPEPGLTNLLQAPKTPDAIRKSGEHPNLYVLTGGTLAPNPSELLGSQRMREFLDFARGRFDRIILDAPPLRVFSDSLVLSQLSDGAILVVWGGATPRPLVQQSAESLRGVKANILGVVLNKIDVNRQDEYNSHYYYSYYSAKKKGARRKRR